MRAEGESAAVRLQLDDFPTAWRVPSARWMPWTAAAVAALGVVRLVLELVGPRDGVAVVLAVIQVVLAAAGAFVAAGSGVRLEPDGYRVGDRVWRGRLRPWSDVREVREASRWTRHPEIRAGGSAADALPVRLSGMSAEQVVELRRRIEEAWERAAREGTR